MTDRRSSTRTNKIDRVIREYDLEGLGDELERRWTGESTESASTRELADLFNRRVLEAAVAESETFTLGGDVDQLYQTLTDEEDADRTLLESRLEQSGVDVEKVTGDFVSHQTIYRYLKDHRGVERPEISDDERTEKAISKVQRLRGRTTAVTEQTIENLRSNGLVSIAEFSVLNDIQVLCEECGRSYGAVELIERGACACEGE